MPAIVDPTAGQRLLDDHAAAALGPRPAERPAIMVTMPSEAADDFTLVSNLLQQGMDCMRINCAHDTPDEWARMIEHLRRAQERHGRSCRVLMDLAGPKIRTGPLELAPAVVKFKPTRDKRGRVTEPARVWLFAQERPRPSPTAADASLPVPAAWLEQLQCDDTIRFVDTRGAKRSLRVVAVDARRPLVRSAQVLLRADRHDADDRSDHVFRRRQRRSRRWGRWTRASCH